MEIKYLNEKDIFRDKNNFSYIKYKNKKHIELFYKSNFELLKSVINNHKKKSKNNNSNSKLLYNQFINFLMFKIILLFLPIKIYTNSKYQIILKLIGIGEQQIFSDKYNISQYMPETIKVNNKRKTLNDKKILLKPLESVLQ